MKHEVWVFFVFLLVFVLGAPGCSQPYNIIEVDRGSAGGLVQSGTPVIETDTSNSASPPIGSANPTDDRSNAGDKSPEKPGDKSGDKSPDGDAKGSPDGKKGDSPGGLGNGFGGSGNSGNDGHPSTPPGSAPATQPSARPSSSPSGSPSVPDSGPLGDGNPAPVSSPSPRPVVCDGLTGDEGAPSDGSVRNGLLGSLHWFPGDPSLERSDAKSALFYVKNGSRQNVDLYFSHLFIPPRNFTEGFQTADGTRLKDVDGRVLEEFFGLHFESILQLRPGMDAPGVYQFALLSDDGAVLKLKTASGVLVLDNDGDHTTRMACASDFVVRMDAASRIPLKLDYYQGPRAGISLVLLWRKIGKNTIAEPNCGVNLGFNAFTHPARGSRHTSWELMQRRGWKRLEAGNFLLPNNRINPCEQVRQP